MVETCLAPVLGLEDAFPDVLHLLHHAPSGKYGCYCHNGVHGVACFTTRVDAMRFSEHISLPGIETIEVSFDEAREIAKARPMPVVALMLLDSIEAPAIHYVR